MAAGEAGQDSKRRGGSGCHVQTAQVPPRCNDREHLRVRLFRTFCAMKLIRLDTVLVGPTRILSTPPNRTLDMRYV